MQGHGAARVGEAGRGGPLPSLPGSLGRWSQRRSEVLKPGREFTAGADCPCTGERMLLLRGLTELCSPMGRGNLSETWGHHAGGWGTIDAVTFTGSASLGRVNDCGPDIPTLPPLTVVA